MDTATLPPDRSPRNYRIANTVFFFISGFGYTTWASRIPSLQQHLHLNEAQLGAALFAMPIGLMLTMPVTGSLLRRFSSGRIMVVGALAFNLMLALLGYVDFYWQFISVLFCFGASRNLLNLSTNTQSVGVQALYERSIITTFHGIWSLAGFSGAALGYLAVYLNIVPTYHLLTVSSVLVILALCFAPHTLYQKPSAQQKKPAFSLPDKALLKFALICFASMACENVMYDWGAIYMQKAVHTSKTTATAGFVVFMIAVTAGRFTGDRLVNRYGIKKLLQYSGTLVVIGFILTVLLPYREFAMFGFAMIGLGVSCIVPLVFSVAGSSKTMSSGSAIAAVSTVGYLGFLLVPPVVGFVAQAASLQWAFGVITLLGVVIVWMTSKIKEE